RHGTAPLRGMRLRLLAMAMPCMSMTVIMRLVRRRRTGCLSTPASSALRGQNGSNRQDARQDLDRLLGRLAQRVEPRSALGFDLDRKTDIAVADDHPGDHAEGHDVVTLVGITDLAQRVQDLLLGNRFHVVLHGAAAEPGRKFVDRPKVTRSATSCKG